MNVNLKCITPNIEDVIVEIARVSSSRTDKTENPEGLLNYLIKNSHWSPFEHGFITFEIETSKAIAIQLLRHRSFTFQELSQRYQNVNILGDIFEPIELRKQATNNRQSSEEVFEPVVKDVWDVEVYASDELNRVLGEIEELYNVLLAAGVAREQARMTLPMCTKTRLYMTGSVRSWIHFLQLRDDGHAQKEAQLIAKEIKKLFKQELPMISKALNY